MFSLLIGLVGVLIALIGWFVHKSTVLLIIGTCLYIVETLLEWKGLNANAKIFDILIFVIGAVVARFINLPFYIGGMLAINFYSALMTLLSLPSLLSQISFFIKMMFRR